MGPYLGPRRSAEIVTLAPDRLEIVASSSAYDGSLAVWDARGFDVPAGRREELQRGERRA